MPESAFQLADAWLLYCVLLGGRRGSDLSTIIGHGDRVYHAIFDLDELQDGFARLISGGLVERDGALYRATAAARKLAKRMPSWRAGPVREIDGLLELLQELPPPVRPPEPQITPTAAELDEAYREYHERFQETYKNLDRDCSLYCLAAVCLLATVIALVVWVIQWMTR